MKFHKIKKDNLKWKSMPQFDYKWNLPLLIDSDYNVLLGNSFKEVLPEEPTVFIINSWHYYETIFTKLEEEILSSDNPEFWLGQIERDIIKFVRNELIINDQKELFKYKNRELLTEENYKKGGAYDFVKAKKIKEKVKDEQLKLIEFDDEDENEEESKDRDYEIDMEIMKELL